jgi:cytochrome oxidase assembly protein ShyY1
MPLPRLRPRLRLRTLLIAVAVVAVVLGGWQMWRRREWRLERARLHRRLAESARAGRASMLRFPPNPEWAEKHEQLSRRYEEVAWFPWLPPPRDPVGDTLSRPQ